MTRADAVKLLNKLEGKFPQSYLGLSLEEILKPLDMTVSEFTAICDKFTNRKVFKTDVRGNLVKDKDGNLVKLYPLE